MHLHPTYLRDHLLPEAAAVWATVYPDRQPWHTISPEAQQEWAALVRTALEGHDPRIPIDPEDESTLPPFDLPVILHLPENRRMIGYRFDDTDGWLWSRCYSTPHWNGETWEPDDAAEDDNYQPTHWQPLS